MPLPSLIWIVDDSPTQAAITERALGGHRVRRFVDGTSALERLNEGELPDLILLDWVMPGLSGDDVCRYVRADPRAHDVPIIMLSASRTETADIVCALEIGVNDYVTKPFVREVLVARVDSLLRARQLKYAADLERRRIATINQLGRALFVAGTDVTAILGELAAALTLTLCDGCAIVLMPGPVATEVVARHRIDSRTTLLGSLAGITDPVVHAFADTGEALAKMPPTAAAYVRECGLRGFAALSLPVRGLLHGIVTVTRDHPATAFVSDDLAAIETCLELVGLAIEAAIRSHNERATTRFHEEMIGIVSHDLRTPLGAMSMGIALLGDSSDGLGRERILRRMARTTIRMTEIVDELLDVTRSRIGTGIPVSPRPAELGRIVSSVLDELRLAYPATTFQQLGVSVDGSWDPDRLGQVVSNLASNAVQYGPPHGTVTIETSRTERHAAIEVRNANRSAPIPPEQLRTMFDPFERGDVAAHSKGLGLGLYIVQEIVRAHSGIVTAASDLAATTFRVLLPIEPRELSA